MDSHQASSISKSSKKRRKRALRKEEPTSCGTLPTSEPPTTIAEDFEEACSQQQKKEKADVNFPSSSNLEFSLEKVDAAPVKQKRHKKKPKCQLKESSDLSTDSVANISVSFIPVVEEALRLLEASEEQMPNRADNPKKSKKKKITLENPSKVESVVSPGAKRLSSELKTNLPQVKTLEIAARSDGSLLPANAVLNCQELELLKLASNIGPIYSRSSLTSSVTVTSSSQSSQLLSDRIQSSHLFSSVPLTSSCEEATRTDKMSPPSVVQKSREEVEAERKARKAAKAAGKGKPKESLQAKPDTSPAAPAKKKDSTPKTCSDAASSKRDPQKAVVEKLSEDVKRLSVSGNEKQTRNVKHVDVPDFARVDHFAIPQEDKIPPSLLHLMPKEKDGGEKSKAELRAERRAKQEAQRSAKAQQTQEKQKTPQQTSQQTSQQKPSQPSVKPQQKDSKIKEQGKPSPKSIKDMKDAKSERRVKLFSHLYQNSFKNISQSIGVTHPQYHSSIVRLGVQYANRVVLGSNARCLALLYSLKDLIADYETPPQKEFSRGLEAYLQPNMEFLQQCRPHSVSMVNALRYIKWQLTQLSVGDTETKAKQHILEAIDQYIDDQIGKAAEAIGKVVKDKIDDNDVILVYACSSLVLSALKVALEEKRKFHVIVVDSLPWLEGREMLRRLVAMGVSCSYVHISATSFVMRQATKVLLGAHALLANGYVMSRAGSSQVALLAHAYNVPVLVCCETHKFSERVQTDSFVYNELADPDELIGSRRAGERETERERPLANWRDNPYLSLLNLVYDVTPPDLVTAVVTERAILPCTSVPVILRIKPTEC